MDALGNAPRWLQLLLDVACVGLAVATFMGLGEPDLLLHGVWVCLAFSAFLFGLRSTLLRIVAATVFVIVYAVLADFNVFETKLELDEIGLSEWPLMVVIAIIVAVMADRVMTTGRRYAALYRATSDRLLTAQEDERRRLARDLHDGVGQTLTGLILTLDAVETMIWEDDAQASPRAREALHRSQEIATGALTEARGVSFRLRPPRIEEAGLAAAIGELGAKVGQSVEITSDPSVHRAGLLEIDREIEIYRIVQEALGNAVRHAHATRIWIVLENLPGGLVVRIGDDGVGFDTRFVVRAGLGLAGMKERAMMLRANLSVRSLPGYGTIIELMVPWKGADASQVGGSVIAPRPVV